MSVQGGDSHISHFCFSLVFSSWANSLLAVLSYLAYRHQSGINYCHLTHQESEFINMLCLFHNQTPWLKTASIYNLLTENDKEHLEATLAPPSSWFTSESATSLLWMLNNTVYVEFMWHISSLISCCLQSTTDMYRLGSVLVAGFTVWPQTWHPERVHESKTEREETWETVRRQ